MEKHTNYKKEQDVLKRIVLKNQMKRLKIEYQQWINNESER